MKIKPEIIKAIVAHAQQDAPIEACGYLAGNSGFVVKHYALTNLDKSREHFSFDPKEQFSVLKEARSNNLELAAVYHSHPASPARPSEEDIKLAYDPQLIYVIVSLNSPEPEVKAFKIKNAKVSVEPLEVITDV